MAIKHLQSHRTPRHPPGPRCILRLSAALGALHAQAAGSRDVPAPRSSQGAGGGCIPAAQIVFMARFWVSPTLPTTTQPFNPPFW